MNPPRTPFLVRPATLADVGAMFRVRTAVRENALTLDELAQIGVTPEAIATAIQSAPCAWIAEADGDVVGFAMVDLDTACLFAAFVLPRHEGQGIGKGLIQTCEAALFERHPVAWLETARQSRAAGVYRHLGWGGETDVGEGDVRMEKRRSSMQVEGISHITFIVRDLERMAHFLCFGLGAREVYDSGRKNFSLSAEKFFVLGGVWLAAMEGEPPAERTYRHLAFKVSEDALPEFEARLRSIGVEVKPPRPRVEGEGLSLYFYDFDNHLFELHTGTLDQRLARYRP